MSFGSRLRAARRLKGLTQLGLAQAAECDPSTVSRIERDEVLPALDTAAALASACGCTLGSLVDPVVPSADDSNEQEDPHTRVA